MIRRHKIWLLPIGIAAAAILLYALVENVAEAFASVTMRQVADIGAVAVIVMALFLIPYSAAALIAYEWHPRIREVHRSKEARFWPSLFITTWMTWANLFGMVFIMGIVLLRLGLQYDQVGESAPQPNWSLALNLGASMILLGLLALPASFLLWVKVQILGLRYEQRNGGDNS